MFGASLFRRTRRTCLSGHVLRLSRLSTSPPPLRLRRTPKTYPNGYVFGVRHLSNPPPIKRRLPFDAPTTPTTPSACAEHKKVPRQVRFVFDTRRRALTPPDTPNRTQMGVFCRVRCPSPHGLCPSIDAEHENAPRWAGFRVGRLSHPTSPSNMSNTPVWACLTCPAPSHPSSHAERVKRAQTTPSHSTPPPYPPTSPLEHAKHAVWACFAC